MARMILIFLAMAGLGALSTAPLNIPRLFRSRDRTWSFDRLFEILFRLVLRELDSTEHVLLVVVAVKDDDDNDGDADGDGDGDADGVDGEVVVVVDIVARVDVVASGYLS